jgi:hypothetical protein
MYKYIKFITSTPPRADVVFSVDITVRPPEHITGLRQEREGRQLGWGLPKIL